MMFTSNQNRNETSVTDSAGGTLQNVSYDPWGNIVDDESGRLLSRDEQPELLLERGFTGHEHLPHFGLINMNARLYEPLTARFLSPDPEVQAPDFTQNLNRYSYCLNNPLRYTDPTGMIVYETNDPDEIQKLLDWFEQAGYTQPIDVVEDYLLGRDGWFSYDYGGDMFTMIYSTASSSDYFSSIGGGVNGMNFLPEVTVEGWRLSIPKSEFPNGEEYKNWLYSSDLCYGVLSSMVSPLEKYLEHKNWSYILTNSKNEFTPKLYFKRFYGNKYVRTTKLSNLVKPISKTMPWIGLINSFQDLINSYTLEEAGVRILDVGFSVVGCIPHPVSTAISTIWSIGGKDLFWITKRNQVDMFVEQQKLGVFGLPSNQPFK